MQGLPADAGGGGRTRTVSLPTDFESVTSANSITPAYRHIISYFRCFVNPRYCRRNLHPAAASGQAKCRYIF